MVADLSCMAWRCRRLAAGDMAAMRALNALFAEAFDAQDADRAALPSDIWLAEALARPDIIVLVAEQGDEVIGGLVAYELVKLEQERRELYLYDLATGPRFRRQGVATALIDKLRSLARQRDVGVVYVQADRDDAPAIALYGKLGTRAEVFHFDLAPETWS
jgi:aminoglycoside 3-N-acetyltransferase I